MNMMKRVAMWLTGTTFLVAVITAASPQAFFSRALGFEAKWDTGKPLQGDPPLPEIAIEVPKKMGAVDKNLCSHAIGPDFEELLEREKMMFRLGEPFKKDGQSFEWRVGQGDGTTYWKREKLDDTRHRITLYFLYLDFTLRLVASSATAGWHSSGISIAHDHAWPRWVPDLGLWFVDVTSGEVLVVGYWSQLEGADTDIDAGTFALRAQNRNARIARIFRSLGECR